MPDLAIRYLPLTDLAPYPKNARTHSPEQVQQIADSIREFGFVNPVLIDEHNTLIAGHGRVLAAQSLGMDQAPAITLEGLTAAQKRALRIADNKLALNAGWSDELLRLELGDLKFDFDLSLTGFSEMEIDQLFAPDTDPEAEWQGMPEFEQSDKLAFKSVVVHLKDQKALNQFAELINQTIGDKTRYIWFPQKEIEHYMDKRYQNDTELSDLYPIEGQVR